MFEKNHLLTVCHLIKYSGYFPLNLIAMRIIAYSPSTTTTTTITLNVHFIAA